VGYASVHLPPYHNLHVVHAPSFLESPRQHIRGRRRIFGPLTGRRTHRAHPSRLCNRLAADATLPSTPRRTILPPHSRSSEIVRWASRRRRRGHLCTTKTDTRPACCAATCFSRAISRRQPRHRPQASRDRVPVSSHFGDDVLWNSRSPLRLWRGYLPGPVVSVCLFRGRGTRSRC
jgi:hypothetical protein